MADARVQVFTNTSLFRRKLVSLAVLAGAVLSIPGAAHALCAAQPEEGIWRNLSGTDPYQVEVRGGDCEVEGSPAFFVTVWVKQSSGALYNRGTFRADLRHTNDGAKWIVPKPYGVGGYFEHLWLREYNHNGQKYLRVWVYDESLDAKPSATSDYWFVR
jgi:hypothetical protein